MNYTETVNNCLAIFSRARAKHPSLFQTALSPREAARLGRAAPKINNQRRVYSPEKRAEAEKLMKEGVLIAEVARLTEVDRATLSNWKIRLGVPSQRRRKHTNEFRAKIKALLLKGERNLDIARKYNLVPPLVSQWRREWEIPSVAEMKRRAKA